MHCDVAKDADVERLGEAALSAMGRVDILMNNAGWCCVARRAHHHGRLGVVLDINLLAWCVASAHFCHTCSSGAVAISSTPALSPG